MGSNSDVSAFFRLRFRNGLGTKPAGVLPFRMRVPNHLFLEFGLVACRLPSLTLRKGLPCLRQPFFFVFRRFQKQHFSICGFAWFGHYISLFLVGSKSDVSRFFRLRFRSGLGAKPAGVLPFRMRAPNTFFLSLAWWLAGFQVLRCAKVCLAVSYGLGTICDCGRAVGYLTMAPSMDFFRCVRLSEPLRQRHRAHAFLESCLQRLPKLCFLWVPTVFLVGSRSNASRFFGLQFRNGLGTKPAEVRFQVFLCAKVILAGSQLFFFFGRSFVAEFSSITCIHFTCHCMVGHAFPLHTEGSAAWAVALQSGSAVLCRRPSHLWL